VQRPACDLFRGTSECSEVQWRFLGLSIPEWALVWFAIFAALAVIFIVRARRSDA
jgi:disulfide bond formation protein DsbB